ncbi:hypothetical protein [Streptomyces griseus]|uniref:hypothetical protein n=1 Tax=Streptomyces griseus TaxID=1911 RepID=UPI000563235D|nr:hypothetical protein [Streptomyces griseus]
MFRPKLPDTPHVPSITTHVPQDHAPAHPVGRPVAPYVGIGAGVVVVGIVLTALLAAVAISAVSVAIAAVVLRSLLNGANRR